MLRYAVDDYIPIEISEETNLEMTQQLKRQ